MSDSNFRDPPPFPERRPPPVPPSDPEGGIPAPPPRPDAPPGREPDRPARVQPQPRPSPEPEVATREPSEPPDRSGSWQSGPIRRAPSHRRPSIATLIVLGVLLSGAAIFFAFAAGSEGSEPTVSGPTPTRTASGSGTGVLQPPPTNIGPQPKPKPEPTGDHPAFQVPVQIKDGGVVAGKVTYRYPIEWSRLHLRNLRVPGGGQQQWVSVVGFTRRNFVAVSGYRSAPQLSKRRVQRDGADEVAAAIADSDGEVIEDRAPTEVSGLRGYTFTVSRPQSDSQIEDEVTVLFGPRAHYVIDCEMTELTRVPVRVGCAKVLRTFSAPT